MSEPEFWKLLHEFCFLGREEDFKAHRALWPDRDAIDDAHREIEKKYAEKRRALAIEIDARVAAGAPWPRIGDGLSGFMLFRPNSDRGQGSREMTDRPSPGYCVRWNGSWWEICKGVLERRAAGYVPMSMCWPAPKPKAGHYISSGARAKFIYRIAEVEPFSPPRGQHKFTCRLWCDRVLPEDFPAGVVHHTFYWHPRKRRAA